MRPILPGVPAAVLALAVAACAPSAASDTTLTVLGAASLREPLEHIAEAYRAATPGVSVTLATDSSAALRAQIEQGAPADVFLAADTTHPQALADAGLAVGPPVPFAGNALAIVVPPDNPAGINAPGDLARDGLRIIAAGPEVPITGYAEQVVRRLGIAEAYAGNVVSREDNVRAVLTKIELGEGDAGIVYVTDARGSNRVATVPIPDDVNPRAVYAGVVLETARDPQAAAAFLAWLAGPGGAPILAEFGFLPAPG